jgi:endonuclease/exonuclease/phosphatase (EEP) superfamily protein YafD
MFGRIRFLLYTLLLALLAGSWYVGNNLQLLPSVNASNQINSCQSRPLLKISVDAQQGLDPQDIRFLNWNIYKQNRDNLPADLSRFAATHDIMTLQEARLDRNLLSILKKQDLNWIMNSAFFLQGDATGVMTVADESALQSCGFLVNEPLIYLPKAALISEYPLKGREQKLLVANLHGINFTLGLEAYHQQLDQLYQALKDHRGPMIVAGDFNSWSDERMAQVMALVNKLSLSKLSYQVNNKTHLFGNAIDHVFFRQLEPLSKQVQQVTSSDHNPISVTFRLRPNLS